MGKSNSSRFNPPSSSYVLVVMTFIAMSSIFKEVESSPEITVVNVEPSEFAPDTQIQDQELYLLTNVTRLEMHCEAHFPVRWDFSGDTSPMQLHVRALRKTGPKLSDPTFSAQLVIFRVSSSITGTYYCRSILNPNKFDKVHIFAQDKGYRGQDPVLIKYGQTIDLVLNSDEKSNVIIPCSTWDPKSPMSLFKKSTNSRKYEVVEPKDAYTYDPKIGFDLNLTQVEEAWGQYFCSPEIHRTFDRVYVNLLRKPDFKVTPNEKVVEIVQGEKLNVRCEGMEEVSILVNGEEVNDIRITSAKNHIPEAEYPYVATLEYSNLDASDESEIECVRSPGSNARAVHNWKYRVVGKFDVKRRGIVKYHSRRTKLDWFACWARTSQSPDLSFVKCTNPQECQIRGHCLRNSNKCDPALVQLCSGGCAHSTIENQTGILQCKGDGVFQQIKQFLGASGSYVYNSMTEAPKEEKLELTGKHVFKTGSTGEFTCTGSTFLYAGGFRWGVKTRGQAVKVLEPSSEEVVGFEETFLPTGHVMAKAVLRLDSPKFVQVDCFAPFWNTTDWDSRAHALYIQG